MYSFLDDYEKIQDNLKSEDALNRFLHHVNTFIEP